MELKKKNKRSKKPEKPVYSLRLPVEVYRYIKRHNIDIYKLVCDAVTQEMMK